MKITHVSNIIVSYFLVVKCNGFQINSKDKDSVMFKDAIEKSLKQKIDPLLPTATSIIDSIAQE
eukprot:4917583-Ditylum_brightwellii.AAC.1